MGKEIPAREKDRRAGARVSKRADSGGGSTSTRYSPGTVFLLVQSQTASTDLKLIARARAVLKSTKISCVSLARARARGG